MLNEFPHTIIFQEKTTVSDGMGGHTEEWGVAFSSDAHVQPLSGSQRFQAQQLQTPVSYRVYYPSDTTEVKPDMRLEHRGDILEIKSDPLDQGGVGEIFMIECEKA